ncbi:MAG: hypothetical protein JNJ54_08955 [Myxococcaceae bacterium]|nr:hypothetical protein [Myxococcaceae bacterium]
MNPNPLTLVVPLLLASATLAAPEVKKDGGDAKLELEVGAGATSRDAISPTVSARVGVDLWNWFTPSVRLVSVAPWAGPESAWAIQGELRAHTRGRVLQLTGGVGLGLATANVVRSSSGLDANLTRPALPWLTGDLGLRALLGPFFVGVAVGGAPLQQQWLASLNLGFVAFGD